MGCDAMAEAGHPDRRSRWPSYYRNRFNSLDHVYTFNVDINLYLFGRGAEKVPEWGSCSI
jgi:hypothetical protein